jgi:hypothetical protein
MGLGSAILELQKNENNERYRNAVLYAATHNTCYDAQVERSRRGYLFDAIKLSGDTYYLEKIIKRFLRTKDYHLSSQLCGLLDCFGENGCEKADEAIRIKFEKYLQKIKNCDDYWEKEILQKLAISLCDIYGFQKFFVIAEKMGNLMLKTENEILTEWFFKCACENFGEKRIMKQLIQQAETSPGKKRFLEEILSYKTISEEREKNRKKKIKKITIESYIENVKNGKPYAYSLRILAKNITLKERVKIADIISDTDDYKTKSDFMRLFYFTDYPYPLEKLFSIYNLENEDLKAFTLKAMARFKDKRLHELAVFNLKNKLFIQESLMILQKNFHNDYDLIYSIQKHHRKKSSYVYHSLPIHDIFSKRRNPKAYPILLFDYYNNPCSHCRTNTVKNMRRNKCLPENIIAECLFDCSLDTRKVAKRYASMKPGK